jgi:hypothetical protein
MTGRQYGTIGLVGVGLNVGAIVALHVLDPGLNPVREYISTYALGDYGWLERVAGVALGVATIGIALGLRVTLASGKRVTTSWVLVLIAGLGFVVSELFATDPTGAATTTASGAIHDIAGDVTLLSVLISAWLLRGVYARDSRYRHLARAEAWFAVLLTVALVLLFALYPLRLVGLIQRIFVVVGATWLFVLAANIRRTDTSTRAGGPKSQESRPGIR